jgi:hypothetical protein
MQAAGLIALLALGRLRRRRLAALAGAAALGATLGCSTPPRGMPETRSEQLEFDRDDERCRLQAERPLGVVRPSEYRICMKNRGWTLPEEDAGSPEIDPE